MHQDYGLLANVNLHISNLGDEVPETRSAAAESLGRMGARQGLAAMLDRINDPEPEVRAASAQALGRLISNTDAGSAQADAIHRLIRAVQDQSEIVRIAALRALGRVGDAEVVDPLLGRVQDESAEVRRVSARMLGAVCSRSGGGSLAAYVLGSLEMNLRNADRSARGNTLSALGVMARSLKSRSDYGRAIHRLSSAFEQESGEVRVIAAEALIHTDMGLLSEDQQDLLIRQLIRNLHRTDAHVRRLAAEALGEIAAQPIAQARRRRAAKALIGTFDNRELNVIHIVAEWIGDRERIRDLWRYEKEFYGEHRLRPLLDELSALRGPQFINRLVRAVAIVIYWLFFVKEFSTHLRIHHVSSEARVAVCKIGEPSVLPLMRSVRSLGTAKRITAIEVLAQLRDARTCEVLARSLSSRKPKIRAAAARALGQMQAGGAVEPLNRAIRDRSPAVREAAAGAFQSIQDIDDIAPLCAALQDTAAAVRRAAAKALGEIGSPKAAEALAAALHDPEPEVRNAALVALTHTGRTNTIDILRRRLPDTAIRETVSGILKKLGWEPDNSVYAVHYWIGEGEYTRCARYGALGIAPLLEELTRLDNNDDTIAKEHVITTLGDIGDPRAVPALVSLFVDCTYNVIEPDYTSSRVDKPGFTVTYHAQRLRRAIAVALGKIGDERATPVLCDLVRKAAYDPGESGSAVADDEIPDVLAALGKIKDGRAERPILGLFVARFDKWRYQAVNALEQIGWRPDATVYAAPYWVARHNWDECLHRGPDVQRYLAAVVEDAAEPANIRCRAVRTLGSMRNDRSIQTLVDALKHMELRSDAVAALAEFGEPCVDALVRATSHHGADVRSAAIRSLSMIAANSDNDEVREHIVSKLDSVATSDKDPTVRKAVVKGVASLALAESASQQLQESIAVLVKALHDVDVVVRDASVESLSQDQIGPKAVPHLIKAVEAVRHSIGPVDPGDERASRAAIRCLEQIGGREAHEAIRSYYEMSPAPEPHTTPSAAKIFRVFVSSTFSDFEKEREILRQEVFPRLEELCRSLGASFEGVDLRWGVSEKATRTQRAMDICLKELTRCQEGSRELNFIALIGDKYGSVPLPSEIPEKLFDDLLRAVAPRDARLLLYEPGRPSDDNGWYRRDDNAQPPVYCLRPRRQAERLLAQDLDQILARLAGQEDKIQAVRAWYKPDRISSPQWYLLESASTEMDEIQRERAVAAVEAFLWQPTEDRIRDLLHSFTQDASYVTSATHSEIKSGILNDKANVDRNNIFCFVRKISGLPPAKKEKFAERTAKGRRHLDEMKRAIRAKLPCENIVKYLVEWSEYSLKWSKEDPDPYGRMFAWDVYNRLSRVVVAEMSKLRRTDSVANEIDQHKRFAQEVAEFFLGRDDMLQEIRHYLEGPSNRPKAMIGPSGSGKTALLAQCVVSGSRVWPRQTDPAVIVRFVGVTPTSTDIRALLHSLCSELASLCRVDVDPLPRDYVELAAMFDSLIKSVSATAESPVVVAVDALDQLKGTSDAENYGWIPAELPDYVKVLVSTLPGRHNEYLSLIENAIGACDIIPVGSMTGDDCQQVVRQRLGSIQRTLSDSQWAEVDKKLTRPRYPLYPVLVFEEIKGWRSYDELPVSSTGQRGLGDDVPEILERLFRRLSADEHYGPVLLGRCLGYLEAARYGLTDKEIIDLLSTEDVLTDLWRRSPRSPVVGQLPTAIWAQLHSDLGPYLVHRAIGGYTLVGLFHRAVEDAVRREFLVGHAGVERHRELAMYFSGSQQPSTRGGTETAHIPNARKSIELLYHCRQICSGRGAADKLVLAAYLSALTDFEFVAAKCMAGLVDELAEDYELALASEAFSGGDLERIDAFARFVGSRRNFLRRHPELIRVEAIHFLHQVVDTAQFEPATPWIRWLNRPARIDCLEVPAGRLLLPLLDNNYILTVYGEDLCLWNLAELRFARLLRGHPGHVTAATAYRDGREVVTADDANIVKTWDVRTGVCSSTTKLGAGSPPAKMLPVPGERLVVARQGGAVELWNLSSDECIWVAGGTGEVEGLSLHSPTGVIIARYGDRTNSLNIETGECESTLRRTTGSVLALSAGLMGSFRAVTQGTSGNEMRLWDIPSRTMINSLPDAGKRVLFTDGTRMLTETNTGKLRVWNLRGSCCVGEYSLPEETPRLVAVSADGNCIAALSRNGLVAVWTLGTTSLTKTRQFESKRSASTRLFRDASPEPVDMALSADGKTLVFSNGRTLLAWDTVRAKSLGKLDSEAAWEEQPFTAVAVSANGNLIIAGDVDGRIYFWDVSTGRKWSRREHAGPINALHVVVRRDWVVSASSDCTAIIWDLSPDVGKRMTIKHTDEIRQVSASDDGAFVLIRDASDEVHAWDMNAGDHVCRFDGDAGDFIGVLVRQESGAVGLSIGRTMALRLWDLGEGVLRRELIGDSARISRYTVAADEGFGICCRKGAPAEVWDHGSWTVSKRLDTAGADTLSMAISPDGRLAVAVEDGGRNLVAWDIPSGRRAWTSPSDAIIHRCTLLKHNGRRLVVAEEEPSSISIRDGESGALVEMLARRLYRDASEDDEAGTGGEGLMSVLVMDDGRRAVSACRSSVAKIWDTQTGRLVREVDLGEVITAMSKSAKGSSIILGGSNGTLKAYDVAFNWETFNHASKDRKPIRSARLDSKETVRWNHEGYMYPLPDQRLLYSTPYALAVMEPDGRQRNNNEAAKKTVPYSFLQDGEKRITVVPDSSLVVWWNKEWITVWNFDTLDPVYTVRYDGTPLSAVAAPNGKQFIVGDHSGVVGIWNVETGVQLPPKESHDGRVTAVVCAPDRQSYLTAGSDGAVIVWDLEKGAEMTRFYALREVVTAAYTPDGQKIVALDKGGQFYLLKVENW